MMLRKKNQIYAERLDQARRKLLLAVKASDEEIEGVACSPDLYHGVQSRIAARRARRMDELTPVSRFAWAFNPALLAPRRSRWALTAAAVVLLVAIALLLSLPKQPSAAPQLAQPAPPQSAPSLEPGVQATRVEEPIVARDNAVQRRRRRPQTRRELTDARADEIATDFLPLTFSADSTSQVSGHLVRVTVPRSALVAMGLPMNAERAGELVRADVFIGDDGLARAIRFIQ